MAQTSLQQVAALFSETGSAHHQAFAATNGDDPNWPDWYAEYLSPRLLRVLGRRFDITVLASHLRRLDAEHRTRGGGEPWAEFYARWFLDQPG